MSGGSLDQAAVRYPADVLARATRARQKTAEQKLTAAVASLKTSADATPTERRAHVTRVIDELQGIKRKAESEWRPAAAAQLSNCRARVDDLARPQPPPAAAEVAAASARVPASAWQRTHRLIVDWLLREGHEKCATIVARDAGIEPCVDAEAFADMHRVIEALRARDAAPALEWASSHRARLRKIGSPLELMIRDLQLIKLVREGKTADALRHVRAHSSLTTDSATLSDAPSTAGCGARAMTLIVLGSRTRVSAPQQRRRRSRHQ